MTRSLQLLLILPLLFLGGLIHATEEAPRTLPLLIEGTPPQAYEILSPIGAGKKTLEEARRQLLVEATKVQADAVFHVICEEGGIRRQGLSFQKQDPYCRGIAIRFKSPKNLPNQP